MPSGKKKYSWGKIFAPEDSAGLDDTSPGFSLGGLGASFASLSRRGSSASALLQAATAGPSLAKSELTAYHDSDTVNQYDEEWSVLGWWRDHKLTYPILSIMARDILTIPVSTISSESAFSTIGRIIEERSRCLGAEMVEMLSLVKDWEIV